MAEEKGKNSENIEVGGRRLTRLSNEKSAELRQNPDFKSKSLTDLARHETPSEDTPSLDIAKKNWYVLRAIGGKEKKVKEYIETEMANSDLKDYVSQVLIPMEKVVQLRSGKKVSKERSFFPGYILIEASLVGETAHTLRNISNVIGFLGDEKGGEPIPLRESEVNRILGKVDELVGSNEFMDNPYLVGDSIKVVDGPFNNFTGIIEEINVEKKKLKVTVKIFGRKTPVELSFTQVEKE